METVSKCLTKCLGYAVLAQFIFWAFLLILANLGISKTIIDCFDIPAKVIFGLFLIIWFGYLSIMPFVILCQIYLWFKNNNSNWLTRNLCIYVIVVLISAWGIYSHISENKCIEACLAQGTDENTCVFSICDGPI